MRLHRLFPALLGGAQEYYRKLIDVQPSDLIALWRLNQAPAGNAYLTFNGTSTQVNCGSAASLDDLHDSILCVDGWFKSADTAEGVLIGKGAFQGTLGWGIFLTSGHTLRLTVRCPTTSSNANSIGTVNDGAWHHFAAYFDDGAGADRKSYIAVDGIWQTAGLLAVGAVGSDAAESLKMGALSAAPGWDLDGSLGWIRISNNDRFSHGVDFDGSIPARTTIPTVDANTVGLWPMNEAYGSVAGDLSANDNDGTITDGDWGAYPTAVDMSSQGNDAAYTGVQLANARGADNGLVPFFDGVNDFVNVYSAAFAADFSGAAGTIAAWAKVVNSGAWSDSAQRAIIYLRVDDNNAVYIVKSATIGRLTLVYKAGAVIKSISNDGNSSTDWIHLALTWDAVADEVKAYKNGSQVGSTLSTLGTWAGSLDGSYSNIGAYSISPAQPWHGWLGPAAIWKVALTPAQIAILAEV